MAEASVTPRQLHDASAGFSVVRGVHETNEPRALNLRIRPQGEHFHLRIETADPVLQQAFGDDVEHELPLTVAEAWGHAQSCRQAWRTTLVDLQVAGGFPFQDRWDHAGDPALLASVLPRLAEAGAKLFRAVFFPRPPGDPQAHEGLRQIGRVLRQEMGRASRWVRVTSDSLFLPWSLVYSDELALDGSDVRPQGFWGYQHLIEQAPLGAGSIADELEGAAGSLEMGLQVDEAIDRDLRVSCLQPVLDALEEWDPGSLTVRRRPTRRQLAEDLRSGPARQEQVLFFCCHAEQEGDFSEPRIEQGYLVLSDRAASQRLEDRLAVRITTDDLRHWIDTEVFARHPLVFLNACGSGQLNSVFYPGFGKTFLGLHASSVIGAETELPAVFAGEFARRFFDALFRGGAENSIGRILFRLRREFLDAHRNPLGLIYSLYRGADSHLRAGLRRRDAGEDPAVP